MRGQGSKLNESAKIDLGLIEEQYIMEKINAWDIFCSINGAELFNSIDWEEIHKIFIENGWEWSNTGTPSVENIKNEAMQSFWSIYTQAEKGFELPKMPLSPILLCGSGRLDWMLFEGKVRLRINGFPTNEFSCWAPLIEYISVELSRDQIYKLMDFVERYMFGSQIITIKTANEILDRLKAALESDND
jgi:hypothetical protein